MRLRNSAPQLADAWAQLRGSSSRLHNAADKSQGGGIHLRGGKSTLHGSNNKLRVWVTKSCG